MKDLLLEVNSMKKLLAVIVLMPLMALAAMPQNGLVAWYEFDGNANDLSGNNKHGVVKGASWASDRFGRTNSSASFCGVRKTEIVSGIEVIGTFSYSLWFRTDVRMSEHGASGTAWNPGNDLIHAGFADNRYVGVGVRVGTDGIAIVEHGGMYRPTVFEHKDDLGTEWHHVVVTVNNSSGEIVYLDGRCVGTASINGQSLSASHGYGTKAVSGGGIGGGQWGYYTGEIDDLRIYNRVLSESDVKTLYSRQENVPPEETGTCAIAFDANGGHAVIDSISYRKIGEVYGTLPIVTRNGYMFDGWYTAAKEGRKVSASTKVTTDITLYAHWRVRGAAGFLTKTFTGSSFNADGNVWAADSDFVQRADKIYAKNLSEKTTVAYGGYMFMVGGVVYNFKGRYDDFATVRVDGKDVVSKGDECQERSGNYTPKETGWHEVEFRVANNGGDGGMCNSNQYGILWKRGDESSWHKVENPAGDSCFVVSPIFTVCGDTKKIDGAVNVEFQLPDGAMEGVLVLNGQVMTSTTNEHANIVWQPERLGENVFVYSSGQLSVTTKVNVVALPYYIRPEPNPPTPVDDNISITPVTRTFEQGGGGGAIITSGSGNWTAAASEPWVVLNATSGNAGFPVAYTVSAATNVGDRVGYVYVSGRVHTVTQHGYESTISPASVDFETQGGTGIVAVETTNRIAWHAKPNADWISITPTSGIGSGAVSYTVAPYNEVATRTGAITVGNQTFTVRQTGRRIKLSTYREVRTDYFSHVIPVTVNALASTHWSVTPNASWISVVDAGNGVGGDSVSLAIADNLNGATRYGTVTIGTETLLIVQGEPITITPKTATADVNGANGFIAVGAWPEVLWLATVKSNWLSILGNTAQDMGCGNVVYTASPNPTLYERTGTIEVAEDGGSHGYPVLTHTVIQPAATASLSPEGYEFEAGGGSCAVTIDTASIVEWKVEGCPDWLMVSTGLEGIGPQTVQLQAAANNTIYPRTVAMKIAENSFAVTQKGRGVEVEYDSILFETDGGLGSFSIHPDGDVAWNAVSSDPTWITVFQNVSGTGDAEISYIVSPYVNNGAARTGYIEVGDKKVYITQRPYEMNIDPYLATVTGDAGNGQVGISAPIGSVWEAIATEPWITVTTKTGSGSGTVIYQFTENLTGKVRTGKIIISGEEYTITQMCRVVMSVGVEGRGSVTGAGSYDYGADVTLTAIPEAGYQFSHWSGAVTGTANPATIKIDEACKATAHFTPVVPVATATTAEKEGVTISWGALVWADQYRVYRAESTEKPESPVATVAKGTLIWKDTTATPGKNYSYWVEAVGTQEQVPSAAVTGKRAVSLTGVTISCVSELFAGASANCTCTAAYNNDTSKSVAPSWSVDGAGATINASGVLTTAAVEADTVVTVRASYTEGGITKTASAQVTICPTVALDEVTTGVGAMTTGGNGAWFGQRREPCGSAAALRSPHLTDGSSAWVGCSVTGAGTLTFKWRKEGTNAGKLALTVNGSEASVCGDASASWATVKKEFTDGGAKTFKWTFTGGANADAHGLVAEICWTPGTAITVNFNANGGSGAMASMTFLQGSDKTLTANAFTRTGYAFAGWATSAGGTVVYANGQSVKNLTATQGAVVDLYAKWTANAYLARFDANGGKGTMVDQAFVYDAEAKPLTANAFTRTGYVFAGWATSKGGEVKYADGAGSRNLASSGVVTLYAQWVAIGGQGDLNSGLVAWYKFDGNANDSSGNGNNGAVHGATLVANRDGKANEAYAFQDSRYIIVPNSSSLQGVGDQVSVAVWVKPTSWDGDWIVLLCKGSGSSSRCRNIGFAFHSWNYMEAAQSGLQVNMSKSLRIGEWQHVAYSSDGTVIKVYVDGECVGSRQCRCGATANSDDLQIGCDPVGSVEYFNGAMDDLRIYNRALSSEEVQALLLPAKCAVTFNVNGGYGVMQPFAMEPGRVYKLPKCMLMPPAGKSRVVGWMCSNGKQYDDEMLVFDLGDVTMTAIWQ